MSTFVSDTERARLERRANVVRFKLMRTLDALDRRRHQALDIGAKVRHRAGSLAMVAGIVVVALASGITVLVLRIEHAATRARRERWDALWRAVAHPERVSRGPSLAKKAFGVVLTTIAAQVAKRATRRLLARGRSKRTFEVHAKRDLESARSRAGFS